MTHIYVGKKMANDLKEAMEKSPLPVSKAGLMQKAFYEYLERNKELFER